MWPFLESAVHFQFYHELVEMFSVTRESSFSSLGLFLNNDPVRSWWVIEGASVSFADESTWPRPSEHK